jgi:hypothetical protein
MCTISASETQADLGEVQAQEDASRFDAEVWRSGGGFLRNEVNITRSGAFFSLPFPPPAAMLLTLTPSQRKLEA